MGILNYEVMFDTYLLTQVSGLSILGVTVHPLPRRQLSSFPLARTDRRKTNSAFFTDRRISIRCNIVQNSRALLDTRLDELKALLQAIEGQLIVPYGNSRRQFTATLDDIRILDSEGGWLDMSLEFLCSDNFGYDLNFTQLVAAGGRTLYNYTDSFNVEGSARWQAPIIKITISAVTGGTNEDFIIRNPATDQTLTVNRTWAAGDLLTVDAQNTTVQVNGTDVNFSGSIPLWRNKGVGYIQTTDGFLTRTKSIFMYYYKRWA